MVSYPVSTVVTLLKVLGGIVAGGVVTIFLGGWTAFARVEDVARKAAREETSGLRTEQKALETAVYDVLDTVKDVQAEVKALRKELKQKDGGL